MIKQPALGLQLANGAGDMLDSITKFVEDFLKHRTPVKYFLVKSTLNNKQRKKKPEEVSTILPEILDGNTTNEFHWNTTTQTEIELIHADNPSPSNASHHQDDDGSTFFLNSNGIDRRVSNGTKKSFWKPLERLANVASSLLIRFLYKTGS